MMEHQTPMAHAQARQRTILADYAVLQRQLGKLLERATEYAAAGTSGSWKHSGDLGRCAETLKNMIETVEWVS